MIDINDEKVKRCYEDVCNIIAELNEQEAMKMLLFTSASVIYAIIDKDKLQEFLDEWQKDLLHMVNEIDAQERANGNPN